jgi:hypothetical protein
MSCSSLAWTTCAGLANGAKRTYNTMSQQPAATAGLLVASLGLAALRWALSADRQRSSKNTARLIINFINFSFWPPLELLEVLEGLGVNLVGCSCMIRHARPAYTGLSTASHRRNRAMLLCAAVFTFDAVCCGGLARTLSLSQRKSNVVEGFVTNKR